MPRISINEVDNTLYSASNTRDNIVFIAGITTKGSYDSPILVSNIQDFIDTFGDRPPENSAVNSNVLTSWEYAYNLIDAGYSVLFRRIVNTSNENIAESTATHNIVDTSGTVIGTIEARYPGSYGNNLYYSLSQTELKVYSYPKNIEYTADEDGYRIVKPNNMPNLASVETYYFNKNLDDYSLTELIELFSNISEFFSEVIIKIDDTKLIDNIKIKTTINVIDENTSELYITSVSNNIIADISYEDAKTILESESSIYSELKDKYLYDIKFITSGGITCDHSAVTTTISSSDIMIYNNILDLAYTRQDCLGLFDIPFGSINSSNKEKVGNLFDILKSSDAKLSYAACYEPWGYKLSPATKTYKWCPPSYIFLITLAESIRKGYFSWQIPAGVNRGVVTNMLTTEFPIGEQLLNIWQRDDNIPSVNPIMNLRNYGYAIYGQRTLYAIDPNERNWRSALREVGVRLVTIDIKKKIFDIAVSLTFEGNNIHTWTEFIGQLSPYLENIKANGGISSFELIMDNTTNTIDSINKNTVVGIVRISPTRAAENFDISFELTQDTVYITDSDSNNSQVVIA